MKFVVTFNQKQCLKFDLTVNESALMNLFCELSTWAEEKIIKGNTYYFLSRNKVVQELPFFYKKPDTVYRNFKSLSERGLVEYITKNKKDYLRLTQRGKSWNYEFQNSDLNPNPKKLGFESEKDNAAKSLKDNEVTPLSTDSNPTDKYNKYTRDKTATEILKNLDNDNPLIFDSIFNSEEFNKRIDSALKSMGLKFDFEKDVYPVYVNWVVKNYIANGLKLSTSNARVKLTSFVFAVMKNGGLSENKNKTTEKNSENYVGPLPSFE